MAASTPAASRKSRGPKRSGKPLRRCVVMTCRWGYGCICRWAPALAAHCQAHLGRRPVVGEFALVAVDTTEVTYIGHDAGSNGSTWLAGQPARNTCALP